MHESNLSNLPSPLTCLPLCGKACMIVTCTQISRGNKIIVIASDQSLTKLVINMLKANQCKLNNKSFKKYSMNEPLFIMGGIWNHPTISTHGIFALHV